MALPSVSVLMPTYKQEHFLSRAIESLKAQTLTDWELIIVDDGSPDETHLVTATYLSDTRIHYHRLECNRGLGFALNYAMSLAQAPLIAYLPSDDVYYADHLQSLITCLRDSPQAVLSYSGVRYHYNRSALGQIPVAPLQLVQVMHHLSLDRWTEREELTTDDLDRMFWIKLRSKGNFLGTQRVSCEWVDHPRQRHKILQEPLGGINTYRSYYQVKQPLRFHTSVGNFIDEGEHYRKFRERPDTPPGKDGLRILLVGELAYNAERILALEERGHRLYGLWMPAPYWYNTVGPLPFGHVEDIPYSKWRRAVRDIQPDVIYALLNWQAVPFAHKVLIENPGIPFVWHFKEGPFICLEKGIWEELIDLYRYSDGQIYSSPEMRDWFATVVPSLMKNGLAHVLDGDLPKSDWFVDSNNLRLRPIPTSDGAFHTVIPGRPIGLTPSLVQELAAYNIHLHFYGDFTQGQWSNWIEKAGDLAPNHLHLHKQVDQEHWVSEFSRYDAGWLHFIRSENEGDLRRANWDDLNYPARLATLVAAGLPLLQYDNSGATVATQSIARNLDIGIFFTTIKQLREQLEDEAHVNRLRDNVWIKRKLFTFDYHVDRLVAFFRQVMQKKG
jgi:glycosyltransferase involved in cell wall biosynthesis